MSYLLYPNLHAKSLRLPSKWLLWIPSLVSCAWSFGGLAMPMSVFRIFKERRSWLHGYVWIQIQNWKLKMPKQGIFTKIHSRLSIKCWMTRYEISSNFCENFLQNVIISSGVCMNKYGVCINCSGSCCRWHFDVSHCSTTGKPTRSFATERVSLDSV